MSPSFFYVTFPRNAKLWVREAAYQVRSIANFRRCKVPMPSCRLSRCISDPSHSYSRLVPPQMNTSWWRQNFNASPVIFQPAANWSAIDVPKLCFRRGKCQLNCRCPNFNQSHQESPLAFIILYLPFKIHTQGHRAFSVSPAVHWTMLGKKKPFRLWGSYDKRELFHPLSCADVSHRSQAVWGWHVQASMDSLGAPNWDAIQMNEWMNEWINK